MSYRFTHTAVIKVARKMAAPYLGRKNGEPRHWDDLSEGEQLYYITIARDLLGEIGELP